MTTRNGLATCAVAIGASVRSIIAKGCVQSGELFRVNADAMVWQ